MTTTPNPKKAASPKKKEKAKLVKKGPAKRSYTNGLCKRRGIYWVCVKRNGKKIERSTGCRDIKSARLVREKVWAQLGQAGFGIDAKGPFDYTTLEKAAVEWYQSQEGNVSERYREQMMEAVRIHMKEWKDLPISEITSDVMTTAVNRYRDSTGSKVLKGVQITVTHSKGGSNRLIRLISALYGWMIEPKKWIEVRPWKVKEAKIQQQSRPVVWPEDVKSFLQAVDQSSHSKNIRLSIRMQIGLGLRETETSTADWRWFDRRNACYYPGLTKNDDTREIPVPPWLHKLLMQEWQDQGKPTKGLILKYGDEGEPIYRGFSKNAISAAGTEIGVDGLHPHRMRATFATAHFEAGTTVPTIMKMLGHMHEKTTFRYIERRSKDAREAQDRVAAAMGL